MPNEVNMLYIYISLILSAALCFVGVVLSIVNVNKYNFGLYLALLSIVTFTVALACFVVKPKICMGPFCLTKIRNQIRSVMTDVRFRPVGSPEDCLNNLDNHEPLQKKRSITEVLLCRKQENENDGDLHEFPLASGSFAQTPQVHIETENANNCYEAKSDRCRQMDEEQFPLSQKKLRFVDEFDKVVKPWSRSRAWTVGCVSNIKRENFRKKTIPTAQHAPRLIMCQDPHLLMHTAFPLIGRSPMLATIPGIARKSYSHEEVIDLSDYYRSETVRKVSNSSSQLTVGGKLISGTRHMSFTTASSGNRSHQQLREKSVDKTPSPYVSWRRSRTIVVKYVPVRNEWLPRAGSPIQGHSELARERSHSSAGLEMMSSPSSQGACSASIFIKSEQFKQPSNSKINFFANLLRTSGQINNRIVGNSNQTETLV